MSISSRLAGDDSIRKRGFPEEDKNSSKLQKTESSANCSLVSFRKLIVSEYLQENDSLTYLLAQTEELEPEQRREVESKVNEVKRKAFDAEFRKYVVISDAAVALKPQGISSTVNKDKIHAIGENKEALFGKSLKERQRVFLEVKQSYVAELKRAKKKESSKASEEEGKVVNGLRAYYAEVSQITTEIEGVNDLIRSYLGKD